MIFPLKICLQNRAHCFISQWILDIFIYVVSYSTRVWIIRLLSLYLNLSTGSIFKSEMSVRCMPDMQQTVFSLLPDSVLWNSPLLPSHFLCPLSSREQIQGFLWPREHSEVLGPAPCLASSIHWHRTRRSFCLPDESLWRLLIFLQLVCSDLVLQGSLQAFDGSETWQQLVVLLECFSGGFFPGFIDIAKEGTIK